MQSIRKELQSYQERLKSLRTILEEKQVSGFLIPRTDAHQGEYVGPHTERLFYIAGFTGSAGTAIVLKEKAAIFVDGRYILQAKQECDEDLFEIYLSPEKAPLTWLEENLEKGDILAYDPWLMTGQGLERFEKSARSAGATLRSTENLVDIVWRDRPAIPRTPLRIHPLAYAGKSHHDKIREIVTELKKKQVDACLLTMSESVNWLFNIRGDDLSYIPINFSFAIVHQDGTADLFIDPSKVGEMARKHLGPQVHFHAYDTFLGKVSDLAREKKTIWLDPATAPVLLSQTIEQEGGTVLLREDPTLLPKACKNKAELDHMRDVHIRDGAALTDFLAWISREAPSGQVDELQAAEKLESFRKKQHLYRTPSFPTISGSGPHGAIVHYRVNEETNRRIQRDDIYLSDSGGQYEDGTTDVTRTIAIGRTTPEQRDRFTRVLKGHIALATVRFPQGTSGSQLDMLGRRFLWEAGIDYAHGTGHGVGAALSVHEGPQRISNIPNTVALQPGMILSNEPGYYKEGAYGIRIENLVIIIPIESIEGAEREMLGFETITLAPIDLNLIDSSLLTVDEKNWLNAYHKRVENALTSLVHEETREWLREATKEIS